MSDGAVTITVLDQSGNPLAGLAISVSAKKNQGGWVTASQSAFSGQGTTDSKGQFYAFTLPANPYLGNDTWSIQGQISGSGVTTVQIDHTTGQVTGPIGYTETATVIPNATGATGSPPPGSNPYINPPTVNYVAWAPWIAAGIGAAVLLAVLIYYRRGIAQGVKSTGHKLKEGAQGAGRIARTVVY